ncbi:uncharacterized protein HKW66_Vig0202800 [Vigna angularis]|uniref:Uncharacterized protein n=1 Tax=Phaseolus angularis TaxID=3914 RepID=A0A8T0JUR4_PHAAN|nr:uncharacterized protein HKW66_Vig0202800 [Vigna angularis]
MKMGSHQSFGRRKSERSKRWGCGGRGGRSDFGYGGRNNDLGYGERGSDSNYGARGTASFGRGGRGFDYDAERILNADEMIVKSLKAAKEDREDMLLIFSTFDNRLSDISDLINGDDSKSSKEEELDRFEVVEKMIFANASMEQFSIAPPSSTVGRIGPAIVDPAENAIQLVMSRLEDEMWHVLICNTIPLDAVNRYSSIRRVSLSFGLHDGAIDDIVEFCLLA